jgi:hypothetical protein|tara:strand:+ start:16 stop:270 length:255 start_codon:yes stop_codon:yes gene_type:complete
MEGTMNGQIPVTTVTQEDAGFGAFCNICQHEDNRYMRFAHMFKCVKVHIENEHGKSCIFMCDRCIKDITKAVEKNPKICELIIE